MSLSQTSKTVFGRPVPQTPAVKAYIANLTTPEDQTKAQRLFMLLAENYRQEPVSNHNTAPGRQWRSLDLGEAFLRPAANTRNEKRLTGLKRKIHNLNGMDATAAIQSVQQAAQPTTQSPTAPRKLAR